MEYCGNRVAVVILNWNGEHFLRDYLPSVVEHTNSEIADVIVADNGSTGRIGWNYCNVTSLELKLLNSVRIMGLQRAIIEL